VIAAGIEQPVEARRVWLHGRFIPLFDAGLPVVDNVEIHPGMRSVLVDLDAIPQGHEGVVAAACQIRGETVSPEAVRFQADGVDQSEAVVCVAISGKPRKVLIEGKVSDFDFADGILRLRFVNTVSPKKIEIDR
jgi:hypothetical protein